MDIFSSLFVLYSFGRPNTQMWTQIGLRLRPARPNCSRGRSKSRGRNSRGRNSRGRTSSRGRSNRRGRSRDVVAAAVIAPAAVERRATRTGGASSWPTPRPHEHHPCCHPAREPLSVSRSDKGEREGREGGRGAAYIASPLCCLSLVAAPPTASHATHLRIAPPHPGDRPPQQVKKLGLEHVCTPDGGAQQPRQQLGQQTWCAIASSGTGRRSLKRLVPLDLRAVTWTTAVSTSTSSGTYRRRAPAPAAGHIQGQVLAKCRRYAGLPDLCVGNSSSRHKEIRPATGAGTALESVPQPPDPVAHPCPAPRPAEARTFG